MGEAAERLELSYRQAKRLYQRYKQGGTSALQHGNAGRSSNRGQTATVARARVELVRERYGGGEANGFGPTLAAEHLAAEHGLKSITRRCGAGCKAQGCGSGGASALAASQAADGQSALRRAAATRRQPSPLARGTRPRRLSDEPGRRRDRARACSCSRPRRRPGRRRSARALGAAAWRAASAVLRLEERLSAAGRRRARRSRGSSRRRSSGGCARSSGSRLIGASSPQAKGRVERHHCTHQDRLVKKMRLAGIADYEAANALPGGLRIGAAQRAFWAPAGGSGGLPLEAASGVGSAAGVLSGAGAGGEPRLRGALRESLAATGGAAQSAGGAGTRVQVEQWRDGSLHVAHEGGEIRFEEIAQPAAETAAGAGCKAASGDRKTASESSLEAISGCVETRAVNRIEGCGNAGAEESAENPSREP